MYPLTISRLIEQIQQQMPPPLEKTSVDSFKCGDPTQPLRGIVITFLATYAVLEQAVSLNANLIITHEPTFFSGRDASDWLESDSTYQAKREFLIKHQLTVWRNHDGIHYRRPDGIFTGMIEKLGWKNRMIPEDHSLIEIPSLTLEQLAHHCKERLGIQKIKIAGNPLQPCETLALLPGASGGKSQIEQLRRKNVDAVICGESPEWETCEYVRDATRLGKRKALIVLGHANSEEAGMEWFANWLRPQVPKEIPITHIPTTDPFQFI